MEVTVLGATGLTGGCFVQQALSSEAVSRVVTLTRRSLPIQSAKLHSVISDLSEWSTQVRGSAIFSGLATSRRAAGGFDKQYLLEHDENLRLAKAGKERGVKTYILVSSSGANDKSMFPYMRLKGECERDIIGLGFDHTVILRPGIIIGPRSVPRYAEAIAQYFFRFLRLVSRGTLTRSMAIDASDIAKAAMLCLESQHQNPNANKITTLNNAAMLELAKA